MGKAKSFVPDEGPKGFQADVEDDGPDVSGLNTAPETEPSILERVLRNVADPRTEAGAGAQKFAQGASYGLSDELQGAFGAADEANKVARETVGLDDAPEDLADPVDGTSSRASMLERVLGAYRKNRDAHRGELDAAQQAQPGISTGMELTGAVLAPGPKVKALPPGATRLARMGNYGANAAPVGAAFGFGKSEADNALDLLKDTSKGAAVSAGTGAIFGGAAHGPLSRAEGAQRAAIERARAEAEKKAQKAINSARSALGGEVQAGHRNLEAAKEGVVDPIVERDVSDELAAFIDSPQGAALRNRVMAGKAEALPGNLSRIEGAQREFDAVRAANAPDKVDEAAERMLSGTEAKEQVLKRMKHYGSRAIPVAIGSGLAAATDNPLVGGAGGLLAAAIMGSPGTSLANLLKHPAIASRLAAAAQTPATYQAPAAAAADQLATEEDRKRLAAWLEEAAGR